MATLAPSTQHYSPFALAMTIAGACLLANSATGDVTYYEVEEPWWIDTSVVHAFPFTRLNVATANEIPIPPSNNTDLGVLTLTFAAENTGLPTDFQLQVLNKEAGYEFWYNHPVFDYAGIENLAVGEPNQSPDSNWRVTFTDGDPVYAFSFKIIDNGPGEDETLSVYGAAGDLLDTFEINGGGGGTVTFVGVTASEAIKTIVFNNEVDLGDDFAIAEFRLSTQPPVCRADLNGDDVVDGEDLIFLLGIWGPCP